MEDGLIKYVYTNLTFTFVPVLFSEGLEKALIAQNDMKNLNSISRKILRAPLYKMY